MFPTLKLKLVLAFGFAVFLTVALTGLGSFYLLRQEQIRTERERVGLLVLPTWAEVSTLLGRGASPDDIRGYLVQRATDWKVRFLLVDEDDDIRETLRGHPAVHVDVAHVDDPVSVELGGEAWQGEL